jgi:hypothetical protein
MSSPMSVGWFKQNPDPGVPGRAARLGWDGQGGRSDSRYWTRPLA